MVQRELCEQSVEVFQGRKSRSEVTADNIFNHLNILATFDCAGVGETLRRKCDVAFLSDPPQL